MQARLTNKEIIAALKAEKESIESRLQTINLALQGFGVVVSNGSGVTNNTHVSQTRTPRDPRSSRRMNGELIENEIIRVLEHYGEAMPVSEVYTLGEFPCLEGALRHAAERNPRLELVRGQG